MHLNCDKEKPFTIKKKLMRIVHVYENFMIRKLYFFFFTADHYLKFNDRKIFVTQLWGEF